MSYIFRAEPRGGSATEEVPSLAWGENTRFAYIRNAFCSLFEGNHMKNMLKKFIDFWKGVWNFIVGLFKHPKDVLVPVLLAEVIFWLPAWGSALLAILVNPWWWTVFGAVIAFWCAPLTPAILIQVAFITFMIKIFRRKKHERK